MLNLLFKSLKYISFFWTIDLIIFIIFSTCIGGTASDQYMNDDIYYVVNHGEYFQVSKIVWYINYWQGKIVYNLILISIVVLNAIVSVFFKNKSKY